MYLRSLLRLGRRNPVLLIDQCLSSWVVRCRAARAQQNGLFDDEIVAVNTKLVDNDGNTSHVVV